MFYFFFFHNKKRNLYLVPPLGLQRSSSELSEGLSPGFYEKVKGLVTQCALLFAPLWTVARQTPLSMGFSRQEYWSGLPCPPPGNLPDPGVKPVSLTSPALAGRFFITSTTWEASSYDIIAAKKFYHFVKDGRTEERKTVSIF